MKPSLLTALMRNHQHPRRLELSDSGTDLTFIKIIDAADFSEVDFTKTWTFAQWVKERPYRTVELSDQAAKYESPSIH